MRAAEIAVGMISIPAAFNVSVASALLPLSDRATAIAITVGSRSAMEINPIAAPFEFIWSGVGTAIITVITAIAKAPCSNSMPNASEASGEMLFVILNKFKVLIIASKKAVGNANLGVSILKFFIDPTSLR